MDIPGMSEAKSMHIKSEASSKKESIILLMSHILGTIQQGWVYHVQVKQPPARMLTKAFINEVSEIAEEVVEGFQGRNFVVKGYKFNLREDDNPGKWLNHIIDEVIELRYKAIPNEKDPIHTIIDEFLGVCSHFLYELKGLD